MSFVHGTSQLGHDALVIVGRLARRGIACFLTIGMAGCGSSATSPTPPSVTPPTIPSSALWTPPVIPGGLSSTLSLMLQGLTSYLAAALNENQVNLPRNPQNATPIQTKITMLQNPAFAVEVVSARRWVEGQASSTNGRIVPIVAVFSVDGLRGEAGDAVRGLEQGLPLLERFYDVPLPVSTIRIWYGFVVGNSGGGGILYLEDRTTYEARTTSTRFPYEAVLTHELGHTYMGHESLNQFLELYTYNAARGASKDATTWAYTRSWSPGAGSNTGVAALLDVCQLIGFDTMQAAYRAIYPLRPQYGAVLAQNVIDAFVSQVPPTLQPTVRAKLNNVGY